MALNVSPVFLENAKQIEPLHDNSLIRSKSSNEDLFSEIFASALDGINTTNNYLSTAENEEIKLALGQSDNTHDLGIALQKASTALQYTVAIRDKFMEAYKEIINMQF